MCTVHLNGILMMRNLHTFTCCQWVIQLLVPCPMLIHNSTNVAVTFTYLAPDTTVQVQIFVHEIFRNIITPPAGLLRTKFRFWSRSVTPNGQKNSFSLVQTLVISFPLTNIAKVNSKRKFVLIQYNGNTLSAHFVFLHVKVTFSHYAM